MVEKLWNSDMKNQGKKWKKCKNIDNELSGLLEFVLSYSV